MVKKKICMLGSFAVGKTSLVQRFVRSIFSEKYLTTVGVKIDQKTVSIDGIDMLMILWDIHGEDDFQKVKASYLSGMSGYLLVADQTRPETIDVALGLRDLARQTVGDVPYMLLVNKADLGSQSEAMREHLDALRKQGVLVLRTSAKTGGMVAEAFEGLGQAMLG